MQQNKQQKAETSIAIYLIIGAVTVLIAAVVYFNGSDFSTLLGYFALLVVVSLFYNYRICIFTAALSIASYGSVTAYLIYFGALKTSALALFSQLIYFLLITAIISWLTFRINAPKTHLIQSADLLSLGEDGKKILNGMMYGLIVVNQKGEVVFLNRTATQLLGVNTDEVLKGTIRTLTKPGFKNLYKILSLSPHARKPTTHEVKTAPPPSTLLLVLSAPIHFTDKTQGTIKILRDITREKEVDRMKSELISIVSHQLRTPLSAIKWGIKMILDGDAGALATEQKNILRKSYQANEKMINLVNDLLNISRIEEDRFIFKFKPASLQETLENTLKEFSYALSEKKMTLDYRKPERPLPKVLMDEAKIHVVLQNILNNALAYTPTNGKIAVSLEQKDKEIITRVEDNGMGIPQDQKHRLFSKFFRANNAIRMQTEGSGLGLFIAQNIIEKHQGRIWAESEENEGSTFYFALPVA